MHFSLKDRSRLIIILCFICGQLGAQNVLDGVYVKDNAPKSPVIPGWYVSYVFPGLNDSLAQAERDAMAAYMMEHFIQPPLKLDECVYFNEALLGYAAGADDKKIVSNFFLAHSKISKGLSAKRYPASLRFFADASTFKLDSAKGIFTVTPRIDPNSFLKPFYFKKHEVTNKEYREFTDWVTDSIMRELLYAGGFAEFKIKREDALILNRKEKIDTENDEMRELLQPVYLPMNERFYKRLEIDTRKLKYAFSYSHGDSSFNTINVYPDTSSWLREFNYSYIEPMENMYYWHPFFDNYPVVGITYYQALAYLDWKTKQEQNKLDAKGSKYKVSYELPSEIEWDIVANTNRTKENTEFYTYDFERFNDHGWITDLALTNADTVVAWKPSPVSRYTEEQMKRYSQKRRNYLFHQLHPETYSLYRFTYCVSECNKNKNHRKRVLHVKSNIDNNGVSGMGSNVSEWMKETYADNWQPMLEQYRSLLRMLEGEDVKLVLALIDYYDKTADKNGQLIRGANWYDNRGAYLSNKNMPGINAKTFLDPSKTRPTVGFRYVVHVTLKGR